MKTVNQVTIDALAAEVSTFATLWKITRTDGYILTFTNHDEDITYNSEVYDAAAGFTPSSIDNSVGLKVDNLEVNSILQSAKISIPDIEAGLYDFARVEVMRIDFTNPLGGVIVEKKGTIGNIKRTAEMFVAEVRGLSQQYTNTVTEEYTPTCRAMLGDARCGVNLQALMKTGAVVTLIDDHTVTTDLTDADGYFNYGNLIFLTGNNAGYSMEVKSSLLLNGEIKLFLRLPYDIQPGDTFQIVPGCDKIFSTCKNKYNNIVNFRGEPLIPSKDRLISGK